MMKSVLALIIIIGTTTGTQTGTGDDHDGESSVELADLLHTETVIMENLRNYVDALDSKIGAIKRRTQEIRAIYDVALSDTNKYFGNPINTLTLIRRMTYDWPAMRNLAWKDVTGHIIENITVFSEFLTFPNDEDLDEAVGSLLKIQDVYQMEPSHVALGEFNGMKFGSQMTWSDCFAIGEQSFRQGDHLVAKVWLQTALEKFPKKLDDPRGSKEAKLEILQTMSNAEYQSGNLKEALRITEEILDLNPKNKRAIAAQATFKEKLKRKSVKPRKTKSQKSTEELLAQEVCRGTTEQYISSSLERTCTHNTANSTFLRIVPVKLETLSVDPFIAICHGIFSETEIENLKNFVSNAESGKMLPKEYSERLEKLTGLVGKKFNDWKSVKSHFYDEIDFHQGISMTEKEKGVGVAWVQLNEPKLGGSIAFPQLEMKVNVPRGSVLYWSTLNEFNEVDYRTKQFMCPVIAGTLEAIRTTVR